MLTQQSTTQNNECVPEEGDGRLLVRIPRKMKFSTGVMDSNFYSMRSSLLFERCKIKKIKSLARKFRPREKEGCFVTPIIIEIVALCLNYSYSGQ